MPPRKAEDAALHVLKTYDGMEVEFHLFLTSALDGEECSPSRPGCFTPRHPLKMWLGEPQSRSGRFFGGGESLTMEGIEPRFVGRPARSLVTVLAELI